MVNLKQLQLNSLLEVTQAINNNLAEEHLYRIFYFITISNLRFKHIALVVEEDEALVCKHSKELEVDDRILSDLSELDPSQDLIKIENHSADHFKGIDLVMPVTHKERVLAFVLVGLEKGEIHDEEELSFIRTLSNIIMVAVENKRLARRELDRVAVRKEIEIASNVQGLLLPKTLPNNDFYKAHVTYIPNRVVGGDYYDFVELDNDEFIFCIADVSGKGMPAALLMSHFQAVFRTFIRQNSNLEDLVKELNYQLLTNSGGMHFVTFFIGRGNAKTQEITFVNAGHNPPVLLSEGNELELTEGTTVLGALDELPFINIGKISYKKDDLILCYTDGVSETTNENDEEYGYEAVLEYLHQNRDKRLEGMHEGILKELDTFRGSKPFPDDLTLFSILFR